MGDMAVSNSIGSNVFDILVGLGLPWALKTLAINYGSDVRTPIARRPLVFAKVFSPLWSSSSVQVLLVAREMCVSSLQYKEELLSLRITTLEQEEAVGHVSPLPLLWNIEYVKRK